MELAVRIRHHEAGLAPGEIQIWDLERAKEALYRTQAHASVVNVIDGCGGQARTPNPTSAGWSRWGKFMHKVSASL